MKARSKRTLENGGESNEAGPLAVALLITINYANEHIAIHFYSIAINYYYIKINFNYQSLTLRNNEIILLKLILIQLRFIQLKKT